MGVAPSVNARSGGQGRWPGQEAYEELKTRKIVF